MPRFAPTGLCQASRLELDQTGQPRAPKQLTKRCRHSRRGRIVHSPLLCVECCLDDNRRPEQKGKSCGLIVPGLSLHIRRPLDSLLILLLDFLPGRLPRTGPARHLESSGLARRRPAVGKVNRSAGSSYIGPSRRCFDGRSFCRSWLQVCRGTTGFEVLRVGSRAMLAASQP